MQNTVLSALSEMFTEAGLINRTEDSETLKLCEIGTKQRIDLTADNFEPGRSMNIDVSITNPRSIQSKSASAGKAAEIREKEKVKHYAEMIESTGSLFSPFVIESFGRWGNHARQLFKSLIERIITNSARSSFHFQKSSIVYYWKAKITMALHRQACTGLHVRINNFIQRKQGIKQEKLSEKQNWSQERHFSCNNLKAVSARNGGMRRFA